jgi:hypothetical protein
MADGSTSPLLGASGPSSSRRTPSQRSHRSEESTPLLSDTNTTPRYDGEEEEDNEISSSPAAASLRSLQNGRVSPVPASSKGGVRWPTIVAVSVLGALVIAIMAGAFFSPAIAEEYAKQSLVIEPTSLSIETFTPTGVQARIQADFKLDASRVKNDAVRNLGRFGTWIAREVESKESKVEVYLPEYGNLLVGTAIVPPVVVNIRNGQITHVNFIADLLPGDMTGIRGVVNDWLDGRLGQLRVQGKGDVSLKSGIFPLGTQSISESLVFEGQSLYQTFASVYFGEKVFA